LVEEGYRRGRCDAGRQFKIRVGTRRLAAVWALTHVCDVGCVSEFDE
jgi:hypothetical protein